MTDQGSTPQAPTMGTLALLKSVIENRLNNYLCDMKPNHDDSICGFNDAWDIVREAFNETLKDKGWLTGKDREAYIATMDPADIVDDVCERPEMVVGALVAVARYARSLRMLPPVTGTGQPAGTLTEEERGLLEAQAHDWQWDGERNATGDQQAIYLAQASGLRKLLALSRTAATPTDGWRPTDPEDEELRLCGLWVTNNKTGQTTWEYYVARRDEHGNAVDSEGADIGWLWEDLQFTNFPAAPPSPGSAP